MAPDMRLRAYKDVDMQSIAHGFRGPELVVALYDGILDALRQASLFMEKKQFRECGRQCTRALTIIAGLRETLDFVDGEPVAANLLHFYNSVTSKIIGAQTRRDETWLAEAIDLVVVVRGAWSDLAKQGASSLQSAKVSGYVDTSRSSAAAPSGAGVAAAV